MLAAQSIDGGMPLLSLFKRIWFGLRDRRDRRSLRQDQIGANLVTWNPRHLVYVRAYYRYCVDLFRAQLPRQAVPRHYLFGNYPISGPETLPFCRIGFQIEHTLVKPGGGGSAGAPTSRTPLPDGRGFYLARLLDRARLARADIIIDYSLINLRHLSDCGGFEHELAKTIHLAPLLFAPDLAAQARPNPIISLFSDPTVGRRAEMLANCRAAGLTIRNIKRCFETESLRLALRSAEILVNVRRSEHHDTIEELRILPALLCGCLVICENGPLRDTLPYARFVIWCSIAELPATLADVSANADGWRSRLFADGEFIRVIDAMRAANQDAVASALARLPQR